MKKFNNKFRIPSTRLQNWDYGWDAAYFITICTHNKEHFFGKVVNGQMVLSNVGIIADIMWYEIVKHHQHLLLDAFVVMPNHLHGIIIIHHDKSTDHDGVIHNPEHDDVIINPERDGVIINPERDGIIINPERDGIIINPVETRHALSLPESRSTTDSRSTPKSEPAPDFEPTPDTEPLSDPPMDIESLPTTNYYHITNYPSEHAIHSEKIPGETIGRKRFQNQGKNTISSILGSYKSSVTKHVHRLGLNFEWQERFFDRIVRDEEAHKRIQHYIINNPKNWGKDRFNI